MYILSKLIFLFQVFDSISSSFKAKTIDFEISGLFNSIADETKEPQTSSKSVAGTSTSSVAAGKISVRVSIIVSITWSLPESSKFSDKSLIPRKPESCMRALIAVYLPIDFKPIRAPNLVPILLLAVEPMACESPLSAFKRVLATLPDNVE